MRHKWNALVADISVLEVDSISMRIEQNVPFMLRGGGILKRNITLRAKSPAITIH